MADEIYGNDTHLFIPAQLAAELGEILRFYSRPENYWDRPNGRVSAVLNDGGRRARRLRKKYQRVWDGWQREQWEAYRARWEAERAARKGEHND